MHGGNKEAKGYSLNAWIKTRLLRRLGVNYYDSHMRNISPSQPIVISPINVDTIFIYEQFKIQYTLELAFSLVYELLQTMPLTLLPWRSKTSKFVNASKFSIVRILKKNRKCSWDPIIYKGLIPRNGCFCELIIMVCYKIKHMQG